MRNILLVLTAAAVPMAMATAAMASKADPAAGKKVYEARCAMCHGTLAAKKPVLPSATDFFKGQYKLTGGDAKKIEKVIKEGAAKAFPGKGSPAMAPVALADKERADVTAFIKTLKGK